MPQALTPAQIRLLIANNLADASNITAAEHRAVEEALIDYSEQTTNDLIPIENSIIDLQPKFKGSVTLTNIGPIGPNISLPVTGDFVFATTIATSTDLVRFKVGLPVPYMNGVNYIVKIHTEGQTINTGVDNTTFVAVFKPTLYYQFEIGIHRLNGTTPKVIMHMELFERTY